MCVHGNEVVLSLPANICPQKENRTVSIDTCIVQQIEVLWVAGIQILGCCCGHNKEYPSFVIEASASQAEIDRAIAILQKIDSRTWRIYQWRQSELKEAALTFGINKEKNYE
jgi:hypothetical protein